MVGIPGLRNRSNRADQDSVTRGWKDSVGLGTNSASTRVAIVTVAISIGLGQFSRLSCKPDEVDRTNNFVPRLQPRLPSKKLRAAVRSGTFCRQAQPAG